MRIRNLLIHRATLLIPGLENGTDEYNRPIYTEPTTRQIKCRLDQLRTRASTDEEGTDFIMSYFLYVGPDEKIDIGMKIFNVIDTTGNVVADGTFTIENVHASYGMRKLHHYELQLSRGDLSYTQPVEPVYQTETVTFVGKQQGDGDEGRKIIFGLTED